MSNYTSENTTILATCEHAGGNKRMLLLHECDSGRLEYVIGSYFTEYKEYFNCPRCGSRLLDSDLPDYRFLCEECDENFYAFEANAAEVTSYSWDWGHYFDDVVHAVDYWKREVIGEDTDRFMCPDCSGNPF